MLSVVLSFMERQRCQMHSHNTLRVNHWVYAKCIQAINVHTQYILNAIVPLMSISLIYKYPSREPEIDILRKYNLFLLVYLFYIVCIYLVYFGEKKLTRFFLYFFISTIYFAVYWRRQNFFPSQKKGEMKEETNSVAANRALLSRSCLILFFSLFSSQYPAG